MPKLRGVELDAVTVFDYEGKKFGRIYQTLASLSLMNSNPIERPKHSSLEAEAQGFAKLRSGQFHSATSLDLSNATASDDEFAIVLKYLPSLTHLNVKKTLFGREATNVLLLENSGPRQRLQRLQRLNTLDSPHITSVEAQDVLEKSAELDICITEMDELPPRATHRHQEIYRQLAALSNLKVLRLGDPGRLSFSAPSSDPQRRPGPNEDEYMPTRPPPSASSSMLDFKLENGLGALSTLTRLKELGCEMMQAVWNMQNCNGSSRPGDGSSVL
ncbi:hypothetical protein BGZ70_000135 [Mortierella alpina]|uniref:Uncharacterized protein n=1 Tax=Mortierella alpina TaxID=64518 RepID=A0A9P6IYM1_MORAP|nr:hypothetical protein BGZ70_000135 [Mortierella alpina]